MVLSVRIRLTAIFPDQPLMLCCSDVCVEAKLDCGHERTLQLCRALMVATKEDNVSLNDFLRVINNFSDNEL